MKINIKEQYVYVERYGGNIELDGKVVLTVISLPGLTIYLEQRKIYRNRQEIPLTTKEYDLLCLLASNRGQVLTYTQIYEKVWGGSSTGNEKIIRFHLCNLRKKIK